MDGRLFDPAGAQNGLRFATLERKLNNMDDARAPVLLVVT